MGGGAADEIVLDGVTTGAETLVLWGRHRRLSGARLVGRSVRAPRMMSLASAWSCAAMSPGPSAIEPGSTGRRSIEPGAGMVVDIGWACVNGVMDVRTHAANVLVIGSGAAGLRASDRRTPGVGPR